MKERNRKNPWLGLASYREGEILYGRDEDIRDLTECVLNDTDTLLYGKSGIGKTSILNAGVLPIARFKGYLPVMIRLSHKGDSPYLCQIVEAVKDAMIPIPVDENGIQKELTEKEHQERESILSTRIREVVAFKNKDNESFYEYFHRHTFHDSEGKRIKLLLIFDQFEEIFTLQDNAGKRKAFFAGLADMLNDVMPDELQNEVVVSEEQMQEADSLKDNDIDDLLDVLDLGSADDITDYVTDNVVHFVFTIREDFLSEFEYYTAAIPSLKHNRYGLRPINQEQASQIIMRPVPGLVDKDVAKLIIEKITCRSDIEFNATPELEVDSAVLSLYLNRLYEAKTGDKITKDLVEEKGGSIIAEFYEDSLKEISDEAVEFIEDKLLTGHGRRNNITMYDAIASGKITEKEIDILSNKRKILRQFNYSGDIRIEFVHDILCPVIKKHKEERIRQKLIKEQQEKLIEEERQKRKELERKNAEKELRRKKKQKRIIITILSLVCMIAFLWFKDYNENRRIYEEYYAQFENIKGWPVGVGKTLTKEQRAHTALYYKLSHKGNKNGNRHTCVDIMSSNEFLTNSFRLNKLECYGDEYFDQDLKAYNDVIRNVVKIKYSSNENKKIAKEEYIDKNGKLLMIINYFYISGKDAWAQFYYPNGENMKIRNNGMDRIKLSWDSIGNIKSQMYYNNQGNIVWITTKENIEANGYIWDRSKKDTTICYILNQFGLPTTDNYETINTIETTKNKDTTTIRYFRSLGLNDKRPTEVSGDKGFSKIVTVGNSSWLYKYNNSSKPYAEIHKTYDDKGNLMQIYTKGKNVDKFTAAYINYKYDRGLLTKSECLNSKRKPYCETPETVYKREYSYDKNGDLIEERRINSHGLVYFFNKRNKIIDGDTIIVTRNFDVDKTPKYIMQIDTINNRYSITNFYGRNKKPINNTVIIDHNSAEVHRVVSKNDGNYTITEYYTVRGNNIIPLPTSYKRNGAILNCFRRITECDDMGIVKSYRIEDADNNIIKSMMYFIQNGQQIGCAVKGIDGNPVRCDKWEKDGMLYYKMYFNKNFVLDDDTEFQVFDEWYHNSLLFNAEYMQDIANREWFNNELLPYIHVLSHKSKMYNNKKGVIDGDRIIKLGNWKYGEDSAKLKMEWNKALENGKIHIVVFRPNESSYDKKSFTLKLGKNESNYIHYHIIMMSGDEKKFFNRFYNSQESYL